MSIKYNQFGEVISVNGITTGQHIGTPMQDAIGTEEENSPYGTELSTVSRLENVIEDAQPSAGGGIGIKKVVFTDRPSIYQWLLDNYQKVIYVNVTNSQYPWWVKYVVHAHHRASGITGFGLVQINSFSDGTLVPSTIMLEEDHIEMSVDEKIDINKDGTISAIYTEPVVIPDEYWSVLGNKCVAYYFDE